MTIILINNQDGEEPEDLTLSIEPSPTFNISQSRASLRIEDDDLPPSGNGSGLRGAYYNSIGMEKKAGKREDPSISFNWNINVPMEGITPKRSDRDIGYTIVWIGVIEPQYTETYALELAMSSYGFARVWVGETLVIDAWDKTSLRSGEIDLKAGRKFPIKIEFQHRNFYDGRIKLLWSSPSQFKQTVPQSQLYPAK